jgi:hypothetical protein
MSAGRVGGPPSRGRSTSLALRGRHTEHGNAARFQRPINNVYCLLDAAARSDRSWPGRRFPSREPLRRADVRLLPEARLRFGRLGEYFEQASLFVDAFTLGFVAGYLREALKPTVLVVHGGNDDVCPKSAAVLAHPPALVTRTTLCFCLVQFTLRLASTDLFVCVEDGEVPPDDLVGGIALDSTAPVFQVATVPRLGRA